MTSFIEMTGTSLTLMELSEEIRYLKREMRSINERVGQMLLQLDNFINYKREKDARSKRKVSKRATERRKKPVISKLERKRAG
jgi:NTP pyrophosphatase (non-canonical NTP hydrolase)